MIQVTSKQEGFRRCGVSHPARPTDHPDGKFTEEQIEILKAEPMLTVVEVEDEVKLNARDLIVMAKGAPDVATLNELAKDESRKSVLDAIDIRRKELSV